MISQELLERPTENGNTPMIEPERSSITTQTNGWTNEFSKHATTDVNLVWLAIAKSFMPIEPSSTHRKSPGLLGDRTDGTHGVNLS